MDFLLLSNNVPFTVAIAFVALLGAVEALSMLIGLSLLGLLDDLSPIDYDADLDSASGVTGVVGWLCLDRLPLLIWLVLLLTSFAVAGLSVNYIGLVLGMTLPMLISVALALLLSAISCRTLGHGLAKLLPKNESSAVSVDALIGSVGVITLGCARQGLPSEAVIIDSYQQKHYVLVEPERANETFPKGTQVVLLNRIGKVWSAAQLPQ